jgi:hypothetical protein
METLSLNVGSTRGDSTNIITRNSSNSIESTDKKIESQKRRGNKKTTKPDTGPRRGNRAAPVPQYSYKPDVKPYLAHVANHGHGMSSNFSSSQHISHQMILKSNGRGSIFVPQYAARNHGELVPTILQLPSTAKNADANDTVAGVDHAAIITQEVWSELARENSHRQSLQRRRSFPAKKSSTRRRDSGVVNEVLRRALKDRGISE